MRARSVFVALSMMVATAGAVLPDPATAAPAPGEDKRTDHQRILEYWTPQRLASAEPRDAALLDANTKDKDGGHGRDRVLAGKWDDTEARVAETTGKVFFLLGGEPYTCSAAAVDSGTDIDLVLTAGHCLWDRPSPGSPGEFASFFMFVPGFEGGFAPGAEGSTVDYDVWTAEHLFTTSGWQGGDYGDDAGVAVVTGARSFDEAFDRLPSVAVPSTEAVSEGETVSAFGYSSSKSWKGRALGYCQGPLERASEPGTYALRCQLGGGASGGPWYDELGGAGQIISVSSYLRHGDNRVYGPVFDEAEGTMLDQAADGACDADERCTSEVTGTP